MLKLTKSYSDSYPNYEFNGNKFVVRDFSLKFYSDCKMFEREFNRAVIKENYEAQKDVVELSNSFGKIFNNLPMGDEDDLNEDPDLFLKVKEKVIENMINNKEDTEHIYMVLMNQGIEFDSTIEIFLCGSTLVSGQAVSNMKLLLQTFTNSENFDAVNFEPGTADELAELMEFVKVVFYDFFLFMQKSKKKSMRSSQKILENTN